MAALSVYLGDELRRRDWSIDEFAKRAGISTSLGYQIIRDGKDNVRHETLAGIAAALGMSASELLRASEAKKDDPIEQAIRQRTAQMREVVSDIPTVYWQTIISKVFDRAIDGAREMADFITQNEPPVSAPRKPRISASGRPLTEDSSRPNPPLADCKRPLLAALA